AFVTEDGPGLHTGQGAADHVQVGAADGARREADDGVGRLLDLRFLHVLEAHVPDAVEHDGFHDVSFWDSTGARVETKRNACNPDLRGSAAGVRGGDLRPARPFFQRLPIEQDVERRPAFPFLGPRLVARVFDEQLRPPRLAAVERGFPAPGEALGADVREDHSHLAPVPRLAVQGEVLPFEPSGEREIGVVLVDPGLPPFGRLGLKLREAAAGPGGARPIGVEVLDDGAAVVRGGDMVRAVRLDPVVLARRFACLHHRVPIPQPEVHLPVLRARALRLLARVESLPLRPRLAAVDGLLDDLAHAAVLERGERRPVERDAAAPPRHFALEADRAGRSVNLGLLLEPAHGRHPDLFPLLLRPVEVEEALAAVAGGVGPALAQRAAGEDLPNYVVAADLAALTVADVPASLPEVERVGLGGAARNRGCGEECEKDHAREPGPGAHRRAIETLLARAPVSPSEKGAVGMRAGARRAAR